MTDGGQCVIMGLLSLLQSWQRGGVEEKQRAYLMGEQQQHKNALKMRNGQNEAEMKLREACLIEDSVVVSLRDKQRCFWPGGRFWSRSGQGGETVGPGGKSR